MLSRPLVLLLSRLLVLLLSRPLVLLLSRPLVLLLSRLLVLLLSRLLVLLISRLLVVLMDRKILRSRSRHLIDEVLQFVHVADCVHGQVVHSIRTAHCCSSNIHARHHLCLAHHAGCRAPAVTEQHHTSCRAVDGQYAACSFGVVDLFGLVSHEFHRLISFEQFGCLGCKLTWGRGRRISHSGQTR